MPIRPSGPLSASIMVVGEAPGEKEERLGLPFLGYSGQELRGMLRQAGINDNKVRFTNVFMTRPPNNKIEEFCGKRGDVSKAYPYPPLSQGKYFLEKHLHELDRLRAEIEACKPDLILALGNTACWALLRRTGIGKLRGSVFPNELVPDGPPVLPTYHPAAILRQWSLRVIAIADLIKAERFVREGFSPRHRKLILDPTIEEVEQWTEGFFASPPPLLSLDVETLAGTVTCIGFSGDIDEAITIPFFDPTAEGKNFWKTAELERRAYICVKRVCESPIPKLGQNILYDVQYMLPWGIQVNAVREDTMIRHHSLYPEMEKSLGFMGSIYTDEAPWKLLRARNKDNFRLDDE